MLRSKDFGLAFAAVIFAIVGLVQLLRIILQWDVTLNGYYVPFAVNWTAFALTWLCAAWFVSLISQPGSRRLGQ